MESGAEEEYQSLDLTHKYFAAIQITRPKSASKTGSFVSETSINQSFKVAKLVLKPVQSKAALPFKSNQQPSTTALSAQQPANKTDNKDTVKRKESHGIELERLTSSRVEKEKKTLNSPLRQQQRQLPINNKQAETPVHSPNQHKSKMDEAARREAREFMKKQREKRKMEVKKEVDKSFVIKKRLEDLSKITKNAVTKMQQKSKSPVKVSPAKDYYSMDNYQMKEIKVLRLKPTSAPKVVEGNLKGEQDLLNKSPTKLQSPVKKAFSPIKKPSTPIKNTQPATKILTLPLQAKNGQQQPQKQELSRPQSSKENRKPIFDDLKLKVPDIKLNMTSTNTNMNRTDLMSTTNNINSVTTIPYFLQNVYQPYPHNFIWAVRKKLEAFVQQQLLATYRSNPQSNLMTPKFRRSRKSAKGRKITHDFIPEVDDDSETNAKSGEQEMQSEANTISEISSIRTDLAKSKSQSQEKDNDDDGNDTTISESIFQSLTDDPFVGKKRESINSEFDRASFNKKVQDSIVPENVSPNTSEKRNNFLSSTKANEDDVFKVPQIPEVNNLNQPADKVNGTVVDEKEEEFRKMLLAFNKSLSHVVEVNHLLSSALASKSSSFASSKKSDGSASVKTHSTSKQEYSSSFEKNIDTNNDEERQVASDTNSSIQTLIENSEESATLKPDTNEDHTIEDPPIVYHQEHVQELTSSTTKISSEKIPRKEDEVPQQNDGNNTLNESRLINLFKLATDAEVSFNTTSTFMESNGSTLSTSHAAFVFNKSSSEIKSWEKSLIERTRGQIAWLELQKQHLRRHGHTDKVSTIKRQQRAILMRLDKERTQLREHSDKSLMKVEDNLIDQAVEQLEMSLDGNGSDARENIERILKQREQKIDIRRKKIEHLIKWQQRLDDEERKLKKIEGELLNSNASKFARDPRKKSGDDLLNTSLKMVKSIDKSLKVLDSVEISREDETVDVKGEKMNKLWFRLTGIEEEKFARDETYHLTKKDLGKFYEDAKEQVLESDLKLLLDASMTPRKSKNDKELLAEKASSQSDVDTMNSIANIETEEEYPGSYQPESEVVTASTENDDELHQFMANQMKVFVSSPVIPAAQKQTTVNDQTFQVQDGKIQGESASPHVEMLTVNKHDESTCTIDMEEDMDVVNEEEEKSSLIFTEPLESIDLSAVDKDGFIIPEEITSRSIQVTDMDDDDDFIPENVEGQLIEDISFPHLEISLNDTAQNCVDGDRTHDLSTITECTEYEQGSSGPISSEIITASHSSTPSSERVNSEIEQRLISINDSLEQVDEAFKKVAIVPTRTTPSSEPTYSTDKDFIDSEEKTKSEESRNLLILSPPSVSSESVTSQITTSTPKVLMPDVINDAETKLERVDGQ